MLTIGIYPRKSVYPVKFVDHYHVQKVVFYILHHLAEAGAVGVFTRIAAGTTVLKARQESF